MIKLDTDVIQRIDSDRGIAHESMSPYLTANDHEGGPPRSAFDDQMIIYARCFGPQLPIISAAGLSRQLRRALMSASDQPVSELIAGHAANGSPSHTDHLAVVPLPAWSAPETDGVLGGIALVLPRHISNAARDGVTRALTRLEREARVRHAGVTRVVTLLLGDSGELGLRLVTPADAPGDALRPRTWTQPSLQWVSATPVALDRHPGDLLAAKPTERAAALEAARASIVGAVRRIGLPAPTEIDVVRSRALLGRTLPRAYPRFPSDTRKPARVLVHVRLRFAQRVRGPILLGAGRYQGLGLCIPDRTPHD